MQLLGELKRLVEEGNNVLNTLERKEEVASAHREVRDKRNSNSEKNQIRPCDHVWFPSVLAYVPEHAVLSMKPVCLCYATHVAERS